jgi:serine/threonine-protein kinase
VTGPADDARRHNARIGEVLDHKYEIVRWVGEGAMGVVFEARHRVIGRRFAIKFLHVNLTGRSSVVMRFRREAEAAARLEHENVVAVVDVGTSEDGTPYLVMEYLDGENVARVLERDGPFPAGKAVQLALQVCAGLEAAHEHGIVHRDLKPENLFLRRTVVKIVDFGIAKLISGTLEGGTYSGLTLGTPFYMSPEQARGDSSVDHRTDIYALGVILYELLSGEKPHPGNNATAVLFHLLKQDASPLSALRPDLPQGLAEVVHRAMAYEPDARFQTVPAFVEALAPFATAADSPPSVEPRRPAIGAQPASVTASSTGPVLATGHDVPPATHGVWSRRAAVALAGLLLLGVVAGVIALTRLNSGTDGVAMPDTKPAAARLEPASARENAAPAPESVALAPAPEAAPPAPSATALPSASPQLSSRAQPPAIPSSRPRGTAVTRPPPPPTHEDLYAP